MRRATIFLLLFLTMPMLHSSGVESVITPYLYPGENYTTDVSLVSISVNSNAYVMVLMKGTPTFLLDITTSDIKFVNDTGTVKSVLQYYYVNVAYPTKDELSSLNDSFNAFEASRASDDDCISLAGLKYDTCTYQNACRSCYTVPVCRAVMQGTQTTPDPTSSPLVASIMQLNADSIVMSGNATIFYNSIANISEESDAAGLLRDALTSLEAINVAANDVLVAPVKNMYDTDFTNPNAIGFCKPVMYNMTSLSDAIDQATALSNRVPTLAALNGQVSSIVGQTVDRAANRTIREQSDAFESYYSIIRARYLNVSNETALALSYIRDNNTAQEYGNLTANITMIRELGDSRNYAQANATALVFFALANQTENDAKSLISTYRKLVALNATISMDLLKAGFYIEKTDTPMLERLDALLTKQASVEVSLNETPFQPSELNLTMSDLNDLAEKSSGLLSEETSKRPLQVNNLMIATARPFIDLALSLASRITPLDPLQKQQQTNSIVAVAIAIFDFAIVIASAGIFIYLVRSKKIALHRVAKVLWAFIFLFLIFFMVLGSLAVYNILGEQSAPTTLDVFLGEVSRSSSIAVVRDATNATDPISLTACAKNITASLSALNKTVLYYTFNGDNCVVGNEGKSRTACLNELDTTPMFIVQQSSYNDTAFYVFYLKRAIIQGDKHYLNDCTIAKVLG